MKVGRKILASAIVLSACSGGDTSIERTTVESTAAEVSGSGVSESSTPQEVKPSDSVRSSFLGDYELTDEVFGTTVSVEVVNGQRTIVANALPDHETGQFPNEGNPNSIAAQSLTWVFPSEPTFTGLPRDVRVPGVAINGVKFEPGTAETVRCDSGETYRVEGLQNQFDLGMDFNNAHVQPTGEYHYHGLSEALVDKHSNGDDLVHIGFAADGHLIVHSVSDQFSSGYELSSVPRTGSGCVASLPGSTDIVLEGTMPDGTFTSDWSWSDSRGNLDECNGTTIGDRYLYVVTDGYPYVPRCLKGEFTESFGPPMGAGSATPPPPPAGAGPQTPPCGTVDITQREVVGGVKFLPGTYLVHAFGLACGDVLGESGILAAFLLLGDDEPLPEPWRHLATAPGAPKFVSGPQSGFRVQRLP